MCDPYIEILSLTPSLPPWILRWTDFAGHEILN